MRQVASMQKIVAHAIQKDTSISLESFDTIEESLSTLSGVELESAFVSLQVEFLSAAQYVDGADLDELRSKAKSAYDEKKSSRVSDAVSAVFTDLESFTPFIEPDLVG